MAFVPFSINLEFVNGRVFASQVFSVANVRANAETPETDAEIEARLSAVRDHVQGNLGPSMSSLTLRDVNGVLYHFNPVHILLATFTDHPNA